LPILGKLTIVALGPLTNLAMAVKLKPEIKNYIKEIFILGGNMDGMLFAFLSRIQTFPVLSAYSYNCALKKYYNNGIYIRLRKLYSSSRVQFLRGS